jgi:hypothetical protein
MGSIVPVPANDADEVRDDEIDVEEEDENAVPAEDGRADGEEPHAGREAEEGEDAEDVQRDAVRVDILEFLLVRWAGWEYQRGFLERAIRVSKPFVEPPEGVSALLRR